MNEGKQRISAGGVDIYVNMSYAERSLVKGVMREIINLETDTPLTPEQVNAITSNEELIFYDYEGNNPFTHRNYDEIVRINYYLAQRDENIAIIKAKEAELASVAEEKEVVTAIASDALNSMSEMFRGQPKESVLPYKRFLKPWEPGPFVEGDVREFEGQIYQLIEGKAHDSTANPGWTPSAEPSLWTLWHGFSRETALPWAPPTGAHNIYKKGEWMIFTDGNTYECLVNTDRGPDVLPEYWRKDDGTDPSPAEPEEPQPEEPTPEEPTPEDPADPSPEDPQPEPPNSNGTARWSEWINPVGHESVGVYKKDDGVTYEGARYVSNYDNNGSAPTDAGWWTLVVT